LRRRSSYNYFIATHVTESDGPGQALDQYFVRQQENFVFATCPFAYTTIPTAKVKLVQKGSVDGEKNGHRNRQWGVMQWIMDAWFIWRWGWRLCTPQTVFIGINNLNAAIGILLKKLGRCGPVVYYVIDYTPRRFRSRWVNWVYQKIAQFAARQADWVWNLSERMREVHCSIFGSAVEKNMVVPIGIDNTAVQVLPEKKIIKNRLVIVSALFESKGIQLAIDALRELPQAVLTIVGTGPYESALRQRAQVMGVADRVVYTGRLSRQQVFAEIAQSRVALATYVPQEHSYTRYADPAKPKEYLACGVPVVITRVPWIAEIIGNTPMGIAIDYDIAQLVTACKRLLNDDVFWHQCRKAALTFMQAGDWETIFAKALARVKVPARTRTGCS